MNTDYMTTCTYCGVEYLKGEDETGLCEEHRREDGKHKETQIKRMVDRFLSWKLPDDFSPDNGIFYNKPSHKAFAPYGTNLFTATQAAAMVKYMLNDEQPEAIKATEIKWERDFDYLMDAFIDDVAGALTRWSKGKGYGQAPEDYVLDQLSHWKYNFKRFMAQAFAYRYTNQVPTRNL